MLHLIGDTAFLLRCRFQYCVRGDVFDEVPAQIGGKIRKAFITERLDRTDDGSRVDLVTFRHFARREEEGLFVIIQDFSDPPTSRATQW